jgi:hypothetical protein
VATIDTAAGTGEHEKRRSRRALMTQALRFSAGLALAGGASGLLVRGAGAQDGSITLTAGGAELFVSPGEAAATGAVASAAATRGLARVQAAAALAGADSGGETFAEGAASLVAADPDRGAVAQSAATVASALREDDGTGATPQRAVTPPKVAAAPSGRAGRGGGGRAARGGRGGGGRSIEGGGRRRRRDQVATLPVAGAGIAPRPEATLFGLASVAAGAGALLLRLRGESLELTGRGVPVAE